MSKHKLYSSDQSSPMLNSSRECTPKPKTSQSKEIPKKPGVDNKNKNKDGNKPSEKLSADSDSDSDADSMDEINFFKYQQRLPYTLQEDELILNFVLKGQNIYHTSSILLWKKLEIQKGKPKRTYQSLKNRFLRNIKPFLFTTYRHLITDEETVQKILDKFPEFRKQVHKREALPGLNLPKRVPVTSKPKEVPAAPVNGASGTGGKEPLAQAEDNISVTDFQQSTPKRNCAQKEKFQRRVEINGDNVQVTFHRDESRGSASSSMGIYKSYMRHKKKNVLVPCSMCGRCGGPEENGVEGGDNEIGAVVVNSGKSLTNGSLKSSHGEKVRSKTSSCSQGSKRRRKDEPIPVAKPSDSPPCSPSLLHEISQIQKLSQTAANEGRNRTDEAARARSPASSDDEDEWEPSEPPREMLSERDIDTLYQEALAHCQKLMDSEEEEAMVHNCLKQNCNAFEFQPVQSDQKMNVESFFVNDDSPTVVEDFSCSEFSSVTQTQNSNLKSATVAKGPLARNMAKMLEGVSKK